MLSRYIEKCLSAWDSAPQIESHVEKTKKDDRERREREEKGRRRERKENIKWVKRENGKREGGR